MRFIVCLLLLVLSGCAVFRGHEKCDEPPPPRLAMARARLSETGLYANIGARTLAAGVVRFRPRFELWSDGAAKERFISLPAGAKIDTTDMDAWQFPKGTKLWKQVGSVETRLLEKTGDAPDNWLAISYVWKGDDAIATPEGRAPDGVPAARQCTGCHGGTPGHVLGFSAIQQTASVLDERQFTIAPPRSLPIPGDATTQAALGYLHANCSHCHNQHRPERTGSRCFDPEKSFDLSLRTSELSSKEATPVYRTAVGSIIKAGRPDDSELMNRFTGRIPLAPRMPAMGTKAPNPDAVRLFDRWIAELGAR